MKMNVKNLAMAFGLAVGLVTGAQAQDTRSEVLRLGSLLRYVVLAERGDAWIATLKIENGKCGRSRADGEDRARRMSRYYDELVQAVAQAASTQLIVERASRLHKTVNASSMYQSCWRTMTNRANLAANSSDIALQMVQAGAGQS